MDLRLQRRHGHRSTNQKSGEQQDDPADRTRRENREHSEVSGRRVTRAVASPVPFLPRIHSAQ